MEELVVAALDRPLLERTAAQSFHGTTPFVEPPGIEGSRHPYAG
jgi:hypothetical protein